MGSEKSNHYDSISENERCHPLVEVAPFRMGSLGLSPGPRDPWGPLALAIAHQTMNNFSTSKDPITIKS